MMVTDSESPSTTVPAEQFQAMTAELQAQTGWTKADIRRLLGVSRPGFAGMLNGSRPAGIAIFRSLEAHVLLATSDPDALRRLASDRRALVADSMSEGGRR